MNLLLFHGRKSKDENLDDWGVDGPTLEGVTGVYVTYQLDFRVHFKTQEHCDRAKALTGWDDADALSLRMAIEDDLVVAWTGEDTWVYYGDWSLYTPAVELPRHNEDRIVTGDGSPDHGNNNYWRAMIGASLVRMGGEWHETYDTEGSPDPEVHDVIADILHAMHRAKLDPLATLDRARESFLNRAGPITRLVSVDVRWTHENGDWEGQVHCGKEHLEICEPTSALAWKRMREWVLTQGVELPEEFEVETERGGNYAYIPYEATHGPGGS